MAIKNKTVEEYKSTLELVKELNGLDSQRSQNQSLISERQKIINELLSNSAKLSNEQKNYLKELVTEQEKEIANQKKINDQLDKERKSREAIVGLAKGVGNAIKEGWKYLQEQDKTIKSTILSLGMSGAKATAMRTSFEDSAKFAARLGGTLSDIQLIQQGFADETGRARAMTASMVEDIILIGKGTGLGVEQATKLGAQFEFMGLDAKRSMDYVQGVVDTSERMGVNTTKVLKNISDNFKKLNTYSFTAGVKGMAKMAMDAEKMQVSMQDALSAADAAKGLEKAIDLAANLQVMGGEFAKTDPFEWMYLARNEPEKLTTKISEMTRGLVTFKKNSEGVFEKFISPADRQRLESVAKSLGISNEEMIKITQRRADLDKMNKELAGTGLSDREKELVQGAAIFNAKSGKFQVELAGSMKDISSLTITQAKSFEQEQKTLKDRAEQAMTFDQTFKATIEILKASLLPLLNTINKVLNITLKPLADLAMKGWGGMAGAAGILLTAAGIWKGISMGLNRAAENFIKGRVDRAMGGGLGGGFGKTAARETETIAARTGTKGMSGLAGKRLLEGQGAKMTGLGKAGAGIGAGLGAAALGVGAGIGAAATGISLLANAMSKLTPEQAKTLSSVVKSLGWFVIGGAAAAAAIMVFGGASTVASVGLLAFGGAVALVGVGIGAAAAGIGLMGMGLAKLATAAKGSGKDMLMLGGGIASMAAGMAMFTVGSLGLIAFSATLNKISKHAPELEKVGTAFQEINTVMHGSKDDFLAVENAVNAISNMNTNGGNVFAQLAALLKTPLKVQFADKNIQLANDITLNIDGQKFMQKVFNNKLAVIHQEELRTQSVNQT
ncbi:MAG: hypothetical protein WC428_00710 [Candidatus Paceibacterota bacterium]